MEQKVQRYLVATPVTTFRMRISLKYGTIITLVVSFHNALGIKFRSVTLKFWELIRILAFTL